MNKFINSNYGINYPRNVRRKVSMHCETLTDWLYLNQVGLAFSIKYGLVSDVIIYKKIISALLKSEMKNLTVYWWNCYSKVQIPSTAKSIKKYLIFITQVKLFLFINVYFWVYQRNKCQSHFNLPLIEVVSVNSEKLSRNTHSMSEHEI